MELPKSVKIVEVGPRDGLQNETRMVPTTTKIDFINLLSETGLTAIETTSFVSPKKIPQLADHDEVYRGITRIPGIIYSALVPNEQGLAQAIQCQVPEIAIFASASESFSQRNINCSIRESLDRYALVTTSALQHGMRVRAYISCVLGCPYEGDIDFAIIRDLALELLSMGCYEVCFGDTIGKGTPGRTLALLDEILRHVPRERCALHFHNTYGQAIANIFAGLQQGISTFDSSVSGLGGCPYAIGATGNVATEDVVYLLNGLGIHHGVDLGKLVTAGIFIDRALQRETASNVARAVRKSPL